MLDAMSLRKHIDYNQHTKEFSGYVDLGDKADTDVEASEVLVFMLVGLSYGWKSPIAYYFSNSLNAVTQKQLVVHALESLYNKGFKTLAITLDGHATNMSMCTLLGADTHCKSSSSSPTSITPLPGQTHTTYVCPDACHMIKLMRNTMEAYGGFRTTDGIVSWEHVKNLNCAQRHAGLRLGNKLSDRHINFKQQRMKVALAVQVLSRSVSKALLTMRSLGDKRFEDCEATAKFLEVTKWRYSTLKLKDIQNLFEIRPV